MPELRISTLGPLIISLDDEPVYSFKTNKVQALLVYLAVEKDRNHSRQGLMELLWPDMPLESGQVNLRQTIYRLRQAIPGVNSKKGGKQVPVIQSDRQIVKLNPDAVIALDTVDFQAFLSDKPEESIAIYRGDFLADFYLIDSNSFEQWAEEIRQSFQRQALSTLSDLAENYLNNGEFEQAQQYAWRQLEIDKLRERAYRQLMTALASTGQRSAALSQFQLCQRRLKSELKLQPSQETLDLYEKIQTDALSRVKGGEQKSPKIPEQRMPIFLLTDIEGSTKLWDQYHEAMLSALFTHNTILENRISYHGGRILELRGDGVKAVFEDGDPLASVIDIQKDLTDTDWGEIGDLRIRMGLHGLPAVRKGYDYFKKEDQYYGPVLNHTARVMDAGWGGQILVSEQVRNYCTLPDGARWVDHGFHEVKSLDQPIHLYQLTHPDLVSRKFPPLRTLSTQPDGRTEPNQVKITNLPPQLTPFIGRKNELDRLEKFLINPETRLVTIVGAGGMGKTRLAIALANRQIDIDAGTPGSDRFTDGIFFIPLAPLNSSDQIVFTILNSLEIPVDIPQTTERSTQVVPDLTEKLLNFLQSKYLLLILDNFEHLLDGSSLISEILTTCPNLHIIITSRERLHLQEEQVFPIQGLEFPQWEAPESPWDFTAMELFLQSARRIKPDFDFSTADMVYLTRICNLIGGMPLGLELAAAWVDMLSLEEIAGEIKKSLDFLETDIRNIPERHRSIRAVFDSSWQYLLEEEREIFPKFSVFRGGFGREAAQKVTGASIRNLASFVNKSLVQFNESEGCYQIHELLRQYGTEQLIQNPEIERHTRENHGRYFCVVAGEKMNSSLKSGDLLAFNYIKDNYSNIFEAWNWSINEGIATNIDKILDGLCLYYDWGWRDKEGLAICQSAIDMLNEKKDHYTTGDVSIENDQVERVSVKAQIYLAFFILYTDVEKAAQILEECKSIINTLQKKDISAPYEKTQCLFLLGVAKYFMGDFNISREYFQESLALSEVINHEFMVLRNLFSLGDIARTLGHPREAKKWYQKSLTRARMKKNRWGEMMALNFMGWAARYLMDYQQARQTFEENLALARSYNNPFEIIRALESLGFLAIFLGNFTNAITHFTEAVSISSNFGIKHQANASRIHIAVSNWLAGRFAQAELPLNKSLSISQKMTAVAQIFPGICRGEYLVIIGNYNEARSQLHISKTMAEQFTMDAFLKGRLFRTLGLLALVDRDYTQAEAYFEESMNLYKTIVDDEQVAWSQAGLARALIGLGNLNKAKEVLADGLWTTIEIKAFIPLLFILPVATLLLAHENPKLAGEAYQGILNSPFLAQAQFIEDVIYQFIPEEVKSNKDEIQYEVKEILWKTASTILTNWMRFWIEEPEHQETELSLGVTRMEITADFVWKMLLSSVLGAIFGIERAKHGQAAGIRTNMMISLASCLFTYIGVTALPAILGISPDTRIPAQIVIGVGFLGAGTLLQTKNKIRGLTTSATIWLVSAIGMTVGIGMYWGAIMVTLFATIVLIFLAPISETIKEDAIEQFKAQKRFDKIRQESDDAKLKRLEALRLWLELDHEDAKEDEEE